MKVGIVEGTSLRVMCPGIKDKIAPNWKDLLAREKAARETLDIYREVRGG